MPESDKRSCSLSFIIKLWFMRNAPNTIRGRITRVGATGRDEQRAVKGLGQIREFIEEVLEHEGAELGTGWQVRRWWRQLWRRRRRGQGANPQDERMAKGANHFDP